MQALYLCPTTQLRLFMQALYLCSTTQLRLFMQALYLCSWPQLRSQLHEFLLTASHLQHACSAWSLAIGRTALFKSDVLSQCHTFEVVHYNPRLFVLNVIMLRMLDVKYCRAPVRVCVCVQASRSRAWGLLKIHYSFLSSWTWTWRLLATPPASCWVIIRWFADCILGGASWDCRN